MMQGDSYGISVEILSSDNVIATPDDVSDVEITIGSLSKTYKNNQVKFNSTTNKWEFPITQEETFKFIPSKVKVQVRVVWKNGYVEGTDLGEIRVHESISKEVL